MQPTLRYSALISPPMLTRKLPSNSGQTEPHYCRPTVRREPEFAIVGHPEEYLSWCRLGAALTAWCTSKRPWREWHQCSFSGSEGSCMIPVAHTRSKRCVAVLFPYEVSGGVAKIYRMAHVCAPAAPARSKASWAVRPQQRTGATLLTRCHRAHAPLTGPHSHCPTRAGGRRCKPAARPTSDAAATRRLRASIREVLDALSKASPSAVSLWRTTMPLQRRHLSATAWSRRNTVSTARSAAHRVRGNAALAAIATQTVELLTGPDRVQLLRRCANPTCSMLFLARTSAASGAPTTSAATGHRAPASTSGPVPTETAQPQTPSLCGSQALRTILTGVTRGSQRDQPQPSREADQASCIARS